MKTPRIAIVGAHSAVAGAVIEALEDKPVELIKLAPLDHAAAGIESLSLDALNDVTFAILAMPGAAALAGIAHARARGAIALDLVGVVEDARFIWPLIAVPPLAPGSAYAIAPGLAGPIARVLSSLIDFGPRLAAITTFESAAIAGKPGMDALGDQVRALLAFGEAEPGVFGERLAFNVIPDVSLGGDAAAAEAELLAHLRSALGVKIPLLRISRQLVPTFSGEGCSIEMIVEGTPLVEAVRKTLAEIPGIRFGKADDPTAQDAADRDEALVGRLRVGPGRLALWIAADRLRAGAAAPTARVIARWLDQSALSS